MDNQPTPPGGASPQAPTNSNSNPNPNPNPNQPAPTPPTGLPATGDVVIEPTKKKHKKGLIITLICVLAVLLIGGGAFAAAYIINNQPANIIASAVNNFITADQVEIDGSVNFALQDSEEFGLESFSLNFDDRASGLSNTTTATLNINFTNGASAPAIELGEVLLNDGVLYIEANGLQDFYDNAFRDNIKTTLMNQILYGSSTTIVTDCVATDDEEEYTDCVEESTTVVEVDPATEAAASKAVDEILDQIGEIITSIDDQWIEISIDDILSSDMLSTVPDSTRDTISEAYKCTISTLNQIPSYSDELNNVYSQNSFITMTSGTDSFYNISLDANNLAGFLNAMPSTKLASDLATCLNTDASIANNVTIDEINSALEYLPQISAKFDGIFDHHLTELKMSEQNDYYSLTTDLKFSYPNNIVVNAPADSRPVMDVVEEVYQGIEKISSSLYEL